MLSRHAVLAPALGLLFTFAIAAQASAAPARAPLGRTTAVSASLDGRALPTSEIPNYHCHDLAYPQIRCYRNNEDRDAALVGSQTSLSGKIFLAPLSASSTGYVLAYAGASYSSSSVVLSQNYPNLATIGWADRISSYKVFTSYTGAFYQNTNYSGIQQLYCCFWTVPYVGDTYNDIFSSFELP